jgi:large repetitive protein
VPSLGDGSTFYDLEVAPASSFTTMTIQICGLGVSAVIEWWNPATQSWAAVSSQSPTVGLPGCVTVTVTSSTTPSLAELTGTVVGVVSPPVVTTSSLQPATAGEQGYSQSLASSGGTTPYGEWAVSSGELPAGLSLDATSGVISGNVSASATTETFSVTVADAARVVSAPQSLTITVLPATGPSSVSLTGPASVDAGSSYSAQAAAVGADPTATYSLAAGAPSWLSVDPSGGTVSGTVPSGIKSFSYRVTATNRVGSATSATETVTVDFAPSSVQVAGPSSVAVGTEYSATASGGANPAPTYSLATGAAAWLAMDASSGAVSGTVPEGISSFSFRVTATNAVGSATSATETVPVTVGATTLELGPSPAPAVPVGSTVTYTAKVSETVGSGALSGKVSFTENSKAISGCTNLTLSSGSATCKVTFATTGSYTISASYGGDPNFGGSSASLSQSVTAKPALTSAPAGTAKVGKPFSFKVTTSGYPIAALTLSGKLPLGLSFTAAANGTATISGTPRTGTGDSYKLTLKATNPAGSVSEGFVLTIDQAPVITSAKSARATVGKGFTFKITTSGYPAARVALTGKLPEGLKFTANGNGTATISGIPRTGGNYKVTLKATNSAGSASQSFVLDVAN